MTIKERAAAATEMLKQAYPDAICALHYTKDYELLFATRLSAQCTDARQLEQVFHGIRNLPTKIAQQHDSRRL